MSRFDASLKVAGDPEPLSARLAVEEGAFRITAADQLIGEWRLEDLDFARVASEFVVEIEGETLAFEVEDPLSFEEAIAATKTGRKKRQRRAANEPRPEKEPRAGKQPRPEKEPRAREEPRATKEPLPVDRATAREAPAPTSKPKAAAGGKTSIMATVLGAIDRTLDRAEKRYGSLLPPWVFNRGTVYLLVAALIVMLVFPSIFSTILLICGFAIVVFGTLVYTDNSFAAKVLPGRLTAIHVLVAGVGTLVLGFLVAVIAT